MNEMAAYTQLMADVLWYKNRVLELEQQVQNGDEVRRQLDREIDILKAQVQRRNEHLTQAREHYYNKVNALEQEIRALKRQLLN